MKYALCIGINDYPGTGSDLSGCVNDATDWATELASRGFNVDKLLDQQATKEKMLDSIKSVISRAKIGETVVITYSGHGTFIRDESGDEEDGTDECLCPHDIVANGPINDDELFEAFNKPGINLVFISDSCHSGTVAKLAPAFLDRKTSSTPQNKVRFLPPATFLSPQKLSTLGSSPAKRRSSPPGRYAALLLSGCLDPEYSYDAWFNGKANGVFTYTALATLKNLNAEATYQQWHKTIRQSLPSQQFPQTPNIDGSISMKKWKVLA